MKNKIQLTADNENMKHSCFIINGNVSNSPQQLKTKSFDSYIIIDRCNCLRYLTIYHRCVYIKLYNYNYVT